MNSNRVLLVVPTTGFGGAEIHTLRLASWLSHEGYRPEFCFPVSSGTLPLLQACMKRGIPVIDAPIAPTARASLVETQQEQARQLRAHVDVTSFRFVIVASPSPVTGIGVVSLLSESRVPAIVIFHLVAENLHIPEQSRLALVRALQPSIRFVCVSEFTRDMLCQALGLASEDGYVDCIPNGIAADLSPSGIDLNLLVGRSDARTVVSVGRLHAQKGCLSLIDAIPRVLEDVPEARFVWFGEGPLREEMLARAAELGVAGAVYLAGYTDRAADVMRQADVVALPTMYEGLSLTLLEAMHAGAAIVTTDASYQDRFLVSRRDAGIAERGNSESLAKEILLALTSKKVNSTYRRNARKVATAFSEEKMLQGYKSIVDEVLKAHQTGISAVTSVGHRVFTIRLKFDPTLNVAANLVPPSGPAIELPVASFFSQLPQLAFESDDLGALEVVYGDCYEIVHSAPIRVLLADGLDVPCAMALALIQHSRWIDSSRAYTLYETLLQLFISYLGSHGSNLEVGGALACARLFQSFENELQLDSFQLERALLTSSLSPHVRLSILQSLDRKITSKIRANLSDSIKAEHEQSVSSEITGLLRGLDLSREDKASLRATVLSQLGFDLAARRYFELGTALERAAAYSTASPRVVFFAEHFNFPPINGGDRRMLSLIRGYQGLGFQVYFCGLCHRANRDAKASQAKLMKRYLSVESRYVELRDSAADSIRSAHKSHSEGQAAFYDFFDKDAFKEIRQYCATLSPEILHVNYCYFAWVAAAVEGTSCLRVLDTHDLVSRRLSLATEVIRLSGGKKPNSAEQVPAVAQVPERYSGLRFTMRPEEIEQIRQFDAVLMISESEASFLASLPNMQNVHVLPMYMPYAPTRMVASQPVRGFYAGGQNLFNLLGAAALENHVIPYVMSGLPDDIDFKVRVVGDVARSMRGGRGIELVGRVPNIESAYEGITFSLCPIPCGTGQNVKIVESLSRGIPVVTYSDIGRSANIVHGVNGLLAKDMFELRGLVADLIQSPENLTELMHSTRQWAMKSLTQVNFIERLRTALTSTGYADTNSTGKINEHQIRSVA